MKAAEMDPTVNNLRLHPIGELSTVLYFLKQQKEKLAVGVEAESHKALECFS